MLTRHMVGLLGGTFDPIHAGHLHIAQGARQHIPLDTIHFIPCSRPPHDKIPSASAADRLAMVQTAIADVPYFYANPIELNRPGISYTVDTILELAHTDHKAHTTCFIMGDDSFAHFDQWEGAEVILEHCHLIVAHRPHAPSLQTCRSFALYRDRFTDDPLRLKHKSHGYIYFLALPSYDISATAIRQRIAEGELTHPDLPLGVQQYIRTHRLYAFTNKASR